jgi:hypothetical protein
VKRFLPLIAFSCTALAATPPLPWTQTLSAVDSDTSQASAQHRAQSDLNWKIEQQRRACVAEKGTFGKQLSPVQCTHAVAFTCAAKAAVSCK